MSDSVWPHRRQPTRLPHPWDSPSKNSGVGCHFLLQCMKVKTESEVAQSCPTLSDPMNCSPPGSSVHGIFQARALEWVAIAFTSWLFPRPFIGRPRFCALTQWLSWVNQKLPICVRQCPLRNLHHDTIISSRNIFMEKPVEDKGGEIRKSQGG